MFKICLICSDKKLSQQIETTLNKSGDVSILRGLGETPGKTELDRYLRIHAPQATLIWHSGPHTMQLILHLRDAYPNLQVGVVCADREVTVLVPFMRAGVRETIFMPLVDEELHDVVNRLRAGSTGKNAVPQSGEVFCFLPAKPGVGASTIAINTASVLARNNGLKVLLVDTDLGSGMIQFMLQIKHQRSIRDAVNRIADMDPNLWQQLITKVGDELDVLHSGTVSPGGTLDSHVLLTLLGFWRRIYDVICLDLSGNLETFSLDLMHEANKIFLVSTSELSALHLLREKAQLLKHKGLDSQVHVIHNRKAFTDELSTKEIEEVIGLPVFNAFRNSYTETREAIKKGRTIRADSTLGLEFRAFAAKLRGATEPNPKRNPLRDMLTGFRHKISKPVAAVEA